MPVTSPPALQVPTALASRGFSLREATAADLPFQRLLYETARPDAIAFAAWPDTMRTRFLDQQFRFQTVHYSRVYPRADYFILGSDREPIGRLIVDRAAEEWCIVDIALMPPWRRRGIGAQLLRMIQENAAQSRASALHLTVVAGNAAQRLYARLGFFTVGDEPPNIAMTWRPDSTQLKIA